MFVGKFLFWFIIIVCLFRILVVNKYIFLVFWFFFFRRIVFFIVEFESKGRESESIIYSCFEIMINKFFIYDFDLGIF